jgi:hypothetical protein
MRDDLLKKLFAQADHGSPSAGSTFLYGGPVGEAYLYPISTHRLFEHGVEAVMDVPSRWIGWIVEYWRAGLDLPSQALCGAILRLPTT